jgi:GntR family phosphonate transport system transcriptional regulator
MRVMASRTVRANAAQARALELPMRSSLLCLNVLGEAEQQPLHFSERFFPLPRFAGLEAVVRASGSITEAFAAHGVSDYTRRDSRITAQMPDADLAAHLRQPVSRPVLMVESVNVDSAGTPIEYATAWFAGDRVKLNVSHEER